MDVSGRGKGAERDRTDRDDPNAALPTTSPTARQLDEAAAETQVNMVSPFAHPRGAKDVKSVKNTKFDLRQFVARHPVPAALAGLALVGGTIAAVIVSRRRRDAWDARLDRLRRALSDAANGIG
jgi:hypothetical protein